MTKKKKKNTLIFNVLFIVLSLGILIFLLKAPPESTAKLPMDDIHKDFHAMGKKEAEKFCEKCHNSEGELPLPEEHPRKFRCLFCHKKSS